jgi:phosphate starvation-inducible PhoH-like protein
MLHKYILLLTLIAQSVSFKPIGHNLLRKIHLYSKKDKDSFLKKDNLYKYGLYKPKSKNQQNYVNSLNDYTSKIIITHGPAGTGKTLFACIKAIELFKSGEINKIVVTRPIVPVEEEEIGFLPGNIMKKMDPWTKPIFDLFSEHYSKSELDNLIYKNSIEICPLAFMRGRTFKNAFIIADEMQNSSPNQMKMLTTRIGTNSKMVITGDLQQTDILKENGLCDFIDKINCYNRYNKNSNLINIVELTNEDIERSEIVKNVINIYDYSNIHIHNTTMLKPKRTYNKSKIVVSKLMDVSDHATLLTMSTDCSEKIDNAELEATQLNKKSKKSSKNNNSKKDKDNTNISNNDAALIPKHHISNHHISPDFSLYYENHQF